MTELPPSFLSLFFLLLLAGLTLPEYINYCYLSCGNIMHTLCNSVCTAVECEPIDPDQNWRTLILDHHNRLRNRVAVGNVTAGDNGKAANMMTLSYDMYLEYVSACWLYEVGLARHDYCRKTKDFEEVGQNVWRGLADVTTHAGVDTFMKFWFGEHVFTSAQLLDKFQELPNLMMYRYYTQLVWAETTRVGCGRCWNTKNNSTVVVCNYGPGGNVAGAAVYERGEPATGCPNGTGPNARYAGLCGVSDTPAEFKTAGLLKNIPDFLSGGAVWMSTSVVTWCILAVLAVDCR